MIQISFPPFESILAPSRYDLHIARGSTLPVTFTFKDADGALQDLTGESFIIAIAWLGGAIRQACSVNVGTAEVTWIPTDADQTFSIPPRGAAFELWRIFGDGKTWPELIGPVVGVGGITETA